MAIVSTDNMHEMSAQWIVEIVVTGDGGGGGCCDEAEGEHLEVKADCG